LSATNTIYYTLDGTDPRLPGGAISPQALPYSGPITINNNTRLFARSHRPGHNLGPTTTARSPWSGYAVATYVLDTPKLEITEIMYNPARHSSNTYTNEDYEFIELRNAGTTAVDLAGFAFTSGIDFRFTSGSLAPGEHIVVVKNRAVFESRYGVNARIAGEYSGSLDNGGERIALAGPMLEPVVDLTYNNTWYPITDGPGFSLVPQEGRVFEPDRPDWSWRSSSRWHGSPGASDHVPLQSPPVFISEALTHTDPPQTDFVEIANGTDLIVDVTGWYLSDDLNNPKKFRIGDFRLQPRAYKVFTEAELDLGANGFALSSNGDEIYLFSANAAGELTGHMDGFKFGAAANGVSFIAARTTDGISHFEPAVSVTQESANSAIRIGPLVITELMFQPLTVGTDDNTRDEYIEIRNNSPQTVTLYDPAHPANAWRLAGGAEFEFPENVSLVPGGILLVVNFDPVLEPWAELDFRTRFGVPTNVPIFGPLKGKLNNTGERISLQRPDSPEPLEPVTVPYLTVDEFSYRTSPGTYPPSQAAGTGKSIHRLETAWAEEPSNWTAASPTPGVYPTSSSDADNDGLPAAWENAHALNDNNATGVNGASGDPDEDGLTNLQEYQAGTDPKNGLSTLRFSAVAKRNNATLIVTVAADRTYSVLYSPSLTPPVWTKLADIAAGAAREVQVTDLAPTNTTRFYRIVTPAQ
jgi:hypothetical protein